MWHKDGCCYLGFSTQSISQCIYSPLSHLPDLSSLQFLHSLYAHANSYSSPDSAQSVLYLTLIKPPLFFFPLHLQERAWVAILSGAHPINLSCQSWDFSTGRVHRSARRVLPLKRESLQTKQKLTFYLLDSERTRVGCDWLLPFHTTAASQLLPNYVLRAEYQWEGAKLIPL